MSDFTAEQKHYLEGFAAGAGIARVSGSPAGTAAGASSGPERIHDEARAKTIAAGGKLVAEEDAKSKKQALDLWDEIRRLADEGKFPKGTDVFLWKFHGLFYVAPAQNSFMCRLRIPGGQLSAHQMRGLAGLAERCAGGYSHVTTRANLQLREIPAKNTPELLMGITELGLTSRGAGADNIRNVTGSPTAGVDPQELIDTQPLCREMHHFILNHREMYGLPRKFNIAFDGGGRISALDDTNDIGFFAVRVPEGRSVPAGVYFRLRLGGITGHHDFARDEGVVLHPGECVRVAEAIVRVFIEHGDRTDRLKARMKYVIDRIGHEKYLEQVEEKLGRKLTRLPAAECEPRPPVAKHGHVGFHAQKQDGLFYAGLVLPVGKLTAAQMRGIASIAQAHGDGTIRLTVWQNLILTGIAKGKINQVKEEIEHIGLAWRASSIRSGLIACTGNKGCKFSASDTKGHAMAIAEHVEARLNLDTPVNIHLTGCHHSCAQHYIGDIGLIAARVAEGEDTVEGYHIHVGGGYGEEQRMAREIHRDVKAPDAPGVIHRMLAAYLAHRASPEESFFEFANRHEVGRLKELFDSPLRAVA